MSTAAISAMEAVPLFDRLAAAPDAGVTAHGSGAATFAQIVANGIDQVSEKVGTADGLVRAFALDDSVPVHQVTYALAQAQMSLDLMVHVRDRLVDGYQQLMNMQL
jgi:flagellar hook-basal body complex protein FliE